jgi:phenylacetate-coenzyme A ligase PaaK-like adenylate-forming protein
LPALRVEGRSDDVLRLRSENGNDVELTPLALATVMEDFAGVHRFQIVQTAPDALDVRLDLPDDATERAIWSNVARALRAHLRTHGLTAVTIRRDPTPPQRSATGGKLRRVLARRSEE